MLLKRKLFTTFIISFSLLVLCLYASPVPRRTPKGTKASVELKKLDGKIKFTQISETCVEVRGKLNKGMTDRNPKNYHILIGAENVTFAQLGIKINPPGTRTFKYVGDGDVGDIISLDLQIEHKSKILDQGTINSA